MGGIAAARSGDGALRDRARRSRGRRRRRRKELRLTDLHLSPLDVVYAPATGRSAPGEIEQRLLNAAAPLFAGMPADSIAARRAGDAAPTGRPTTSSYGEFAEMVRAAHALVTGTRGIDGSELNLPEANQPAGVDIAELKGRADRAAQASAGRRRSWRRGSPHRADASLDTRSRRCSSSCSRLRHQRRRAVSAAVTRTRTARR